MIPVDVRQDILNRLAAVSKNENVRILLAIESGSRAWGFASPDSDYDVRFIYAREPDWYMSVDVEDKRDVIEYPITDDIDLNGWDIRKALRLFLRSNPTFAEWIQSPIQYMVSGNFVHAARELLPSVYSCERGIYHYRSMAKTNYRNYLRADRVPLKKYFYVLRPLLAVRWIETYRTAPPIEFQRLLSLLAGQDALLADIHSLLEKKKQSIERELALPVRSLNAFIENELARLETLAVDKTHSETAIGKVNALFRKILAEKSS
ncbi:MAG: nucleotidyltransferase domain-containing protein [Pseudomonadota bacterium]